MGANIIKRKAKLEEIAKKKGFSRHTIPNEDPSHSPPPRSSFWMTVQKSFNFAATPEPDPPRPESKPDPKPWHKSKAMATSPSPPVSNQATYNEPDSPTTLKKKNTTASYSDMFAMDFFYNPKDRKKTNQEELETSRAK